MAIEAKTFLGMFLLARVNRLDRARLVAQEAEGREDNPSAVIAMPFRLNRRPRCGIGVTLSVGGFDDARDHGHDPKVDSTDRRNTIPL